VKGKDNKGQSFSVVKPYLMDLESKNGTFLNSDKIEPARYYELLPKDVIKFAMSSRDYVVMKDE
jgi:smad nuclear-interacting protein 1